jgi:hypothetical protein
MATALVLSLALQQFVVAPFPCEVGQQAVFSAVAADGKPMAGLTVVVERPDGSAWDVGATNAAGEVRFVPTDAGRHLCVAKSGGSRWIAPLQVVKAPMRWLYAAVCTPLGLVLLWKSLRRRKHGAA